MQEPTRRPEKRIRRCALCAGDHWDESCDVYATLEERLQRASQRGICVKCFAAHLSPECRPYGSGCAYCRSADHNIAVCPNRCVSRQPNGSTSRDRCSPSRNRNSPEHGHRSRSRSRSPTRSSSREGGRPASRQESHNDTVKRARSRERSPQRAPYQWWLKPKPPLNPKFFRPRPMRTAARSASAMASNSSIESVRSHLDPQFSVGIGASEPANVPSGSRFDSTPRLATFPDCVVISDSSGGEDVEATPAIVTVKRAKPDKNAQKEPSGRERDVEPVRGDLEKREAMMAEEKVELERQRKELESKDRAVRAREMSVKRQAAQLVSAQSKLAEERLQLDRDKNEVSELQRDLASTTAILAAGAEDLGNLKTKLNADQANLDKQRADDGRELQEAKATIKKFQEQLADAVRTRTSASHKAQTQIDEAHINLAQKDQALRQAHERCSATERDRDHFRGEKDALRLTIEFRDEQLQLRHHSAPHSSTMTSDVVVKQEMLTDSTELALASARNATSSTSDTCSSSSSQEPAHLPHAEDASSALQRVQDELANEFSGDRDTQLVATKYCAFLVENVGRTPDLARLLEFLHRVEPENATIVDRIEKVLRNT